MTFQTNNCEILKKVFTNLSKFHEELIFRINSDHLYFNIMTRDNTSCIILKLNGTIFQKYDFTEIIDIKIKSELIKKVFTSQSKDDVLNFDITPDKSQLQITINSTKIKKEYELPLLNIEEKDDFKTSEPSMNFTTETKIKNEDILAMLNCLIFSKDESIRLIGDNNLIEVKEDQPQIKTKITLKDYFKTSQQSINRQSSKFAFNLIKPLVEMHSNLLDESSYFINNDYPLKIKGTNAEIELITILAPRVDDS